MSQQDFDATGFLLDKEEHQIDRVQEEIDKVIQRHRLLDPPPDDVTLEQAIEIAQGDVRADIASMKDALTHFVQSVKHLPLYNQIESYVDGIATFCVSMENLLDGRESLIKGTREYTPKMVLAHLLTMTYNHYRGTDPSDEMEVS